MMKTHTTNKNKNIVSIHNYWLIKLYAGQHFFCCFLFLFCLLLLVIRAREGTVWYFLVGSRMDFLYTFSWRNVSAGLDPLEQPTGGCWSYDHNSHHNDECEWWHSFSASRIYCFLISSLISLASLPKEFINLYFYNSFFFLWSDFLAIFIILLNVKVGLFRFIFIFDFFLNIIGWHCIILISFWH